MIVPSILMAIAATATTGTDDICLEADTDLDCELRKRNQACQAAADGGADIWTAIVYVQPADIDGDEGIPHAWQREVQIALQDTALSTGPMCLNVPHIDQRDAALALGCAHTHSPRCAMMIAEITDASHILFVDLTTVGRDGTRMSYTLIKGNGATKIPTAYVELPDRGEDGLARAKEAAGDIVLRAITDKTAEALAGEALEMPPEKPEAASSDATNEHAEPADKTGEPAREASDGPVPSEEWTGSDTIGYIVAPSLMVGAVVLAAPAVGLFTGGYIAQGSAAEPTPQERATAGGQREYYLRSQNAHGTSVALYASSIVATGIAAALSVSSIACFSYASYDKRKEKE